MNRREYAQDNKARIETKAQEKSVKTLRSKYYKVLSERKNNDKHFTLIFEIELLGIA